MKVTLKPYSKFHCRRAHDLLKRQEYRSLLPGIPKPCRNALVREREAFVSLKGRPESKSNKVVRGFVLTIAAV